MSEKFEEEELEIRIKHDRTENVSGPEEERERNLVDNNISYMKDADKKEK